LFHGNTNFVNLESLIINIKTKTAGVCDLTYQFKHFFIGRF